MKLQRVKDVALGAIVATLLLGVAPSAFAKVGEVMIPVTYNNIKVSVDGEKLKTDKDPFIYDGITYLPVRAVAEAVSKDVNWDSATKTVTLTNIRQKPEEEKDEIKELEKENSKPYGIITIDKNIVDQNDIKIRCLEFDSNVVVSGWNRLTFNLKNFTSMNYEIAAKEVYVNGKPIESMFYAKLLPIAEVEAELVFFQKDLENLGFTEVRDVRIIFHIENSDDYASSFDTKEVTIKIDE